MQLVLRSWHWAELQDHHFPSCPSQCCLGIWLLATFCIIFVLLITHFSSLAAPPWNITQCLPTPPATASWEIPFPGRNAVFHTAEKHFYGQWWGNMSLRNFQRKPEPVSSFSGILLSQREKLRSWRPWHGSSLHTHLLLADDPISDIKLGSWSHSLANFTLLD